MFGVVLWSDSSDQKAVIWCEDHGDLAFYRQTGRQKGPSLDVGDWVQFDLVTERNQRMATNPKLVKHGICPSLPDVLRNAGGAKSRPTPAEPAPSAKVVPFSRAAERKKEGGALTKAYPA
ncbi:hypothetical protein [Ruegeria aquimaris]|uniref:Uncharacterized protein n=1 Tax=Ruegeria aquimaris TaxID=2984333 RepID=A0ABT3AKI5_9RHOB|nr:hypothetical protein [Ruegeria sp. XHP0148]MCV2889181.1 hypothetical protein [Ruegeria sp. XHP0148]